MGPRSVSSLVVVLGGCCFGFISDNPFLLNRVWTALLYMKDTLVFLATELVLSHLVIWELLGKWFP